MPRTDAVLADPRLAAPLARLGRPAVKAAVSEAQDRVRHGELPAAEVVDAVLAALPVRATSLQPVLNATGVLVHTNLGRAPLSEAAVEALTAAAGPTDVEYDLATGSRARRGRATLAALAEAVPDAEAVHVVNNNAAALLLLGLSLAGREIVLSRGELVEIGDGFRLPELLESTGARLREVGATNRTSLADYERALNEDTGCILKVHPSNFTISGFTSNVSVAELAPLARRAGAPLVVDVGSGLLAPSAALPTEPSVAGALRDGADLVTASGDKLLGGPQCGLLLGRSGLVDSLRRHPAARALRVDKLTLAALEATLRGPVPPVPAYLSTSLDSLRTRAAALASSLAELGAEAVPSTAAVGGGGAPGVELPSAAVALPERFAVALRAGDPPVVGRVEHGRCLLDLRAVPPAADPVLAAAVREAAL